MGHKKIVFSFFSALAIFAWSGCSHKSAENTSTGTGNSPSAEQIKILQDSKDSRVYYVFGGKRHYVPNPATLQALGLEKQVQGASDSEIDQIAPGDPLPSLSSKVIQKASTGEVFLLENGKRRHVPDPETLQSLHVSKEQVQGVLDAVVDAFPLGDPLPSAASK